jgi:hypothetical protein
MTIMTVPRRHLALALVGGLVLCSDGLAAAQGRQNAYPPATKSASQPKLQGFSVVLLLGSQNAALVPTGIPAPAAKALADLKDFLPYKSYQLLDTEWLANGTTNTTVRGVNGKDYKLTLNRTDDSVSGPLSITAFQLRSSGEQDVKTEALDADAELLSGRLDQLRVDLARARAASTQEAPQVIGLERQVEDTAIKLATLQRQRSASSVAARESVINTSLKMDVGETVVVGTSRLQGDQALIVLLTAVPKTTR